MSRLPELSRRTLVLTGGAGAAAGALALVGCAPGGETDAPATTDASSPPSSSPPSPGGGTAGGEEIATLAEVPVGGSVGVDVGGQPVLLAQPAAGEVVAFSAICTHQGCVVGAAGDRFECPCHGSVFDAATGDVLQGPALEPLPPFDVRVEGDRIVAGG